MATRIDPDDDDQVKELMVRLRAIVLETRGRKRDLLVSIKEVEKGFHDTHEVSYFLPQKRSVKNGAMRR